MRSLLCTALLVVAMATTGACNQVDQVDYHGQLIDVPREALAKQSARVVINGGEFATYTTDDGSFTLHSLPVGSHLAEVSLAGYRFPGLRIDVSGKKGRVQTTVNDGSQKSLGVFYFESTEATAEAAVPTKKQKRNRKTDDDEEEDEDESESVVLPKKKGGKKKGRTSAGGSDTIRIPCSGKHAYFEEHVPFNPMSYLKNPMVLMLGLTGVMAYMSSKMPKNEMKAAMRDINQGVSAVQDKAKVGGAPRAVKPNAGERR